MNTTIEHNGVSYYLINDNGIPYYKRSTGGVTIALHRVIWEETYGAIPDGYHIHHKDGNSLNNDVSNLELLTNSNHIKLHAPKRVESWAMVGFERTCAYCGKPFTSHHPAGKYCSKQCEARGWKHNHRAEWNAYMRAYRKRRATRE